MGIQKQRRNRIFKNITDTKIIRNIFFHKIFPQLFPITGYKNHSQCSFVINNHSA